MNPESDNHVIKEINVKLGLMDLQKSRSIISRVLHIFREQIDEDGTDQIINRLPPNLLMIYFSSWDRKTIKTKTHHLDQFVNRVMYYDRSEEFPVFHTEIEVLKAVITVLSNLDRHYQLLELLPFSIKEEIERAMITEAA